MHHACMHLKHLINLKKTLNNHSLCEVPLRWKKKKRKPQISESPLALQSVSLGCTKGALVATYPYTHDVTIVLIPLGGLYSVCIIAPLYHG